MLKILLAEDEPGIRQLLRRAFERSPYQVLTAADAAQALEIAKTQHPDLILMDLGLPHESGEQLILELRECPSTATIPIVLMTAHGAPADRLRGFELGADDYVAKPFDLFELTARVEWLLRNERRSLSANPVTLLPGEPTIAAHIQRRLREGGGLALLYVDIDDFKGYNGLHGFGRGDALLKETADILLEASQRPGCRGDLVGHLGGDGFVIVSEPERAEAIAKRAARRFDAAFPMLSLSIALVTNEEAPLTHFGQIAQIAAELAGRLKAREDRRGSRCLKNRRMAPAVVFQ